MAAVTSDRSRLNPCPQANNEDENIIEREIKEQMRRETEFLNMYRARKTQSPDVSSRPDDVTSASCSDRRQSADTVVVASGPDGRAARADESRHSATNASRQSDGSDRRQSDGDGRTAGAENGSEQRRSSSGGGGGRTSFTSRGEALVYREMMEQRQREAELRSYWKQIGIEPPTAVVDDVRAAVMKADQTTEGKARDNEGPRGDAGGRASSSATATGGRAVAGDGVARRSVHGPDDGDDDVVVMVQAGRRSGVSGRSSSASAEVEAATTTRKMNGGPQQRQSDTSSRSSEIRQTALPTAASVGADRRLSPPDGVGLHVDISSSARSRRTRSEAEMLIEREVREIRRREEELRKLRECVKTDDA